MKGHRVVTVVEDDGRVEQDDLFLPNIKSVMGFLRGTWNFRVYDKCFEGRNKLGDVDGSIELYGHTLHLEFKLERNALTAGQLVKAVRQAKHSNITTLFIFGETDRPKEYLRIAPDNLEGGGFVPCNVYTLSKVFTEWNDYAKANRLTTDQDNDWNIAYSILNAVGGGKNKYYKRGE